MNLDKQIIHIRTRATYVKSLLSEEEKKEATDSNGVLDENKLPRETVGNIILNCLSVVPVESKLEGFYANSIANILFGAEREVELQEKFKKFLLTHLDRSIMKTETKGEKEEIKGLYSGWVISQVMEELGEKFDA